MASTLQDSGPCPFLGRCDDPDNYYAFPTDGNCCYAGPKPFAIEPPHQVGHCLGDSWSECPLYREPVARDSEPKVATLARVRQAMEQSPIPWEFVGLAILVLGILTAVWFLALRPRDASEEGTSTLVAATVDHVATSAFGTSVVQEATETPTPTASPTRTPSRTPTPSPSPTATPTSTRTPRPSPTARASITPSQTPSTTPSRTPRPANTAARPTATPTSTRTQLPSPELLSPEDGWEFTVGNEIVLRWESVGTLPEDAYYVVTVAYYHLGETWYDKPPWLRETSWTLSEHEYLVDLADDGRFFWSVQVMLRTGQDTEGSPTGIALSPSSETWSLIWHRPTESVPTPTPPPP